MHLISRTLIIFCAALALIACSNSDDDSSSSSTLVTIEGWVGAQGFDSAQVVVNQIAESGQVAVDTNGIYFGFRESTDTRSKFIASIDDNESTLLIARGQIANVDRDNNNLATRRLCQLMTGCTINGTFYAFNEYYPLTSGFEWRGIVYNADAGSRNNVNSITTLADAFAYRFDVLNKYENGVYTAYDILLANSQLSNLLELTDVIGDLPANLTELDHLNSTYAGTANQIRYGALIVGLQQLELTYRAAHTALTDVPFITQVASEFADDEGQLFYHTPVEERVLTLVGLYKAARDNLVLVLPTITNSAIKTITSQSISLFDSQIVAAEAAENANVKTIAAADDLTALLTAAELADFSLGLEKTKLFVESLIDYQNTFWEEGYKVELDAYQAMLKAIGDANKDNFDALVVEYLLIQDYYVSCSVAEVESECNDPRFAELAARNPSFDSATKILSFDDGIVVSQVLANLSVTSGGAVTESNAVDVLITGTLTQGDLELKVNHTFNDEDKTDIKVPASVRVYYTEKVTAIRPDLIVEGYEIIWGDFQLYDKTTIGLDAETDLTGAFRMFYRGVYDQQAADPDASELRFNIENWVLSSLISDSITEGAADGDITTLVISAQASNPTQFYPNEKFTSFDGFFTPNNENDIGDTVAGLLTYRLGEEVDSFDSDSITVEVIDFINTLGDDVRYRFFPDMQIEDKNDSNGNGNTEEFVTMHLIEECELAKGTENVVKCGPKTRIYETRNLQKTINELWKLGVFQYTDVDGQGRYFIDFLTEKDEAGCLVLQTLAGTVAMNGELLEQQVLGLDSLRLFSEISLQTDEGVTLPRTLSDMTIIAPTAGKYQINAALSHNYSGTTTDSTNDSEVILGTGSNTNIMRISYDTSADFENSGNFSVFQGGVELTLEDGSQVVENQDITAFLSQTYNPENVHYKIIENADGGAERCIISVGEIYEKNPNEIDQVYYLNYRNVIYGTARADNLGVWVIRYIDGSTGPEGFEGNWATDFINGSWLVPFMGGGS
ncbi:MAG: hypothetical protein JKY50_03545 [Oleispira sp.]|nr:hypothetical protein [Oleispira sp.]